MYVYIYIYICFIKKTFFKSEERTAKKGRFNAFPSKLFFLKKSGLKIIFLHNAEVVAESCPVKKVFLEVWQNSQESICGRVFFSIKLQALGRVFFSIKLQALGLRPATLLKKRLWWRCFPMNFAKF